MKSQRDKIKELEERVRQLEMRPAQIIQYPAYQPYFAPPPRYPTWLPSSTTWEIIQSGCAPAPQGFYSGDTQ